jgi:2-keto-3-deoxy-L-fuconate dehydrogenase
MNDRLMNKKVLVTQSDDYMGPGIEALFTNEGAEVVAVPGSVPTGANFKEYIRALDTSFDIVVANLAHAPCNGPTADIDDNDWRSMFDCMVEPLMCIVRHYAPLMAATGKGKIVAITSAAPLRGIPGSTAYCAARGAQNAFVKASGLEYAATNVQINAVAQNYVSNPVYFPDDLVATEKFQNHLKRNVPRGRVAETSESAELALFLASDKSDFIVGQIIPFSGGWATNA